MPGWKIIGIVVEEACLGANTIPKAILLTIFVRRI